MQVRHDLRARRGTPAARSLTEPYGEAAAEGVRAFHASLPGYVPTPLYPLHGLAARVGIEAAWLKDESPRFGLGAFKALGASYAAYRAAPVGGGQMTLVAATDGNHGRAVAWAAGLLGHRARVYLPVGASDGRAQAIADLGAEVHRVDGTYDDAVARAAAAARAPGRLLLQDMAWPGYEEIPRWIMQGYLTLIHEALEQLDGAMPTHVLLQCGVGSFAASILAHLVERTAGEPPRCVLVEPLAAACALAAFESDGATPPRLPGDTRTFMACLACGQLSHGAWPILRAWSDAVVACPDATAAAGMRRLARPYPGDPAVESGESGAVTAGLLEELADRQSARLRSALRLSEGARVLLVSTEGATDRIVYEGTVATDPAASSPRLHWPPAT